MTLRQRHRAHLRTGIAPIGYVLMRDALDYQVELAKLNIAFWRKAFWDAMWAYRRKQEAIARLAK